MAYESAVSNTPDLLSELASLIFKNTITKQSKQGITMSLIQDQFLKIDQVCEILQISRCHFWKLRKQGLYKPTVLIGESPRWSLIELQELLQPKT